MTWPTRYSDLSTLHLAELRLAAAVNALYPLNPKSPEAARPAAILSGHEAWRTAGRNQRQQGRAA